METPTASKQVKYNRWLPYLAVLQSDVRLIHRSWVYRTWVLGSILATAGYLLYHAGVHHKSGMIQSASQVMSQLLQWTIFGSMALIIVLTASSTGAIRNNIFGILSGTAPVTAAALDVIGANYYKAAAGVAAGTLV